MTTNEIKAMIEKYGITIYKPGVLRLRTEPSTEDSATIKTFKPEIIAYIEAERKAAEEELKRKQRTFDAIPGVVELREANRAWDRWDQQFSRSMESEDGCSFLPAGPTKRGPVFCIPGRLNTILTDAQK